jgi:hypothetical protein
LSETKWSEKDSALQSRNSAETDLVLLHLQCNFQEISDFL